jgi:FAD/FMN-containing dehydrogenase
MGGAVGRIADGATAFPDRSMPFVLNAVTGWHDRDAATSHTAWARAVVDAASDASTGRAYVNFLGDTDATRSAYGEETYTRLVALKNAYDPTNVFRLNHNIEPQAAGS